MSSMAVTWSPSSFQLRFALNCRKSTSILVRTRFQRLDRRNRVFCVVGDAERSGGGVERRRASGSWLNSESLVDATSGWSDGDSGDRSGETPPHSPKKWLGGIVGAGVAGLILVAGLAFATSSLSKRSSSRPKQSVESLTTQEEASLSLASEKDKVEDEGVGDNNTIPNDHSLESKTGIDMDSSSPEVNKTTVENIMVDDNTEYTSNDTDASIQEDLQSESAFDDTSVAPDVGPSSPIFPESDNTDGLIVASILNDSDGSPAEDNNSSFVDATPGDANTDSKEVENSNLSLDIPSDSAAFSGLVSSRLDEILEAQIEPNSGLMTVTSVSIKEEIDVIEVQQVSTEGNKSSMEADDSYENGPFGTTSVSEIAYPFANEPHTKPFLKSRIPENSFSSAGIPAPSLVSAALQVLPGKVLIPAVVDQVQGQALAALQVLKVIEADALAGDLCTRREYARWLVSASSALSRNTISKVYPAMYIENVTELAFDDITPEDPDFSSIQGLAEAGLIASKLSIGDMLSSLDEDQSSFLFSPQSPLSRQDLVSWKMALEKRQLPEADQKVLYQLSGFIDIAKINPDACPALVADLSAGEQGIIALAFGYTRLFQPNKPVTKAQAAIALSTGEYSDVVNEELTRIEAESIAENVVEAHTALVAQVEKDLNASFEKELLIEREKIDTVEKLAEKAKRELETLRAEREEESNVLIKERAVIDTEMEVLSRLRREVEEQLEGLLSNKVEISYEKERINNLRKEAETENQAIARLQYELEVERKALAMARGWAEEEAKRAREQAKSLEEARDRWQKHGIKVIVDDDLREEASIEDTWLNAETPISVDETMKRAETLVDKLKSMAADLRGKSIEIINRIIQTILTFISTLRARVSMLGPQAQELKDTTVAKVRGSVQELQQNTAEFSLAVKEGAKRVAGDCREGVEKITQRFKA